MRLASPLKYLSIAAAAVAATTVLTLALPSHAQPMPPAAPNPNAPQPPHMMRGGAMPHHAMSPEQVSARAQKRLDRLEKKLNLQPNQQAAFSSYKSAVLAQANERAAKMKVHHEQMQQRQQGHQGKEMSAPERMEQHAKMMREQADAVSRMAQSTQQFYQSLTPDQRTIFDLMSARHGKGRGMMGMMRHDMHNAPQR